jgi:hypothetical protein
MRTRGVTLGVTFLIAGLLLATGAWAKKITAAGSVTLVQCAGIDASGNCLSPSIPAGLIVTAVTGKRHLKDNITQQLPLPGPLYALAFFVEGDKDKPHDDDFDTQLVLINTDTLNPMIVRTTVKNSSGVVLFNVDRTLAAGGTAVVVLSDELD